MASMFEQPRNAGTLFLGGTKVSGADIRDQNGNQSIRDLTEWKLIALQYLPRKLSPMS